MSIQIISGYSDDGMGTAWPCVGVAWTGQPLAYVTGSAGISVMDGIARNFR